MLAWLFASRIVQTDAWDKRQEKGFLFTIGDEQNHPRLPKSVLRDIFGDEIANGMFDGDVVTSAELLRDAQEKWHVYHLNCTHRTTGDSAYWRGLLGENAIDVEDHTRIPEIIGQIIMNHPETEGSFDSELFLSSEPVGQRQMEV